MVNFTMQFALINKKFANMPYLMIKTREVFFYILFSIVIVKRLFFYSITKVSIPGSSFFFNPNITDSF